MNKLFGFRTNKIWKKIIACMYYIFCLILLYVAIKDVPEIKANIYDIFIYKSTMIINASAFLIPILFLSNFSIKKKIPLLKENKLWSDILSFIIIAFLVLGCGKIINMCHSVDYWNRIKENLETEIIYKEYNPDVVAKEDESLQTEEQLKQEFADLIDKNGQTDSDVVKDNDSTINPILPNVQKNIMKVHYIDVGQGDSIFIELPNNLTMLIDAGESSKGVLVSNYISNLGYGKIDYIIGTHPHTDHIGGLSYIINNFAVGNIYMPKAVSTSKTYEKLLNTISQKGLKVKNAKAGINIINNDKLKINIIAPNNDSYNNLNNYSAVIKIVYGNRSFLFMGDAETKSESEILSNVRSDVIKIGHHGSDTSSGQTFIDKVQAKYAIVMVGQNNRYEHPYQRIIDRWKSSGTEIFRTDLNGNIVVSSDSNSLEIESSK